MYVIATDELICFSIWGNFIERSMAEQKKQSDYFQFYDLQVKFHPDQAKVKSKFYELSKKYHRDFFSNESAERQEDVLQKSTENNKACKTLSNKKNLVKYVLELKNILIVGEQYVLNREFLMEMMDVNESLMDLEFTEDIEQMTSLKNEITEISSELDESLLKLTLAHDELANDDLSLLQQIKDVYYRQKYVYRIKERLND